MSQQAKPPTPPPARVPVAQREKPKLPPPREETVESEIYDDGTSVLPPPPTSWIEDDDDREYMMNEDEFYRADFEQMTYMCVDLCLPYTSIVGLAVRTPNTCTYDFTSVILHT